MENINHHKNGPQKSGKNGKLGEIANHRRFDESWDISFLGQKNIKAKPLSPLQGRDFKKKKIMDIKQNPNQWHRGLRCIEACKTIDSEIMSSKNA